MDIRSSNGVAYFEGDDSDLNSQLLLELIQAMVNKSIRNLQYDYKIPAIIASVPSIMGNTLVCSIDIPKGDGTYLRTGNVKLNNGIIVDVGDYIYATAINGDPKQLMICENVTYKKGTVPLYSQTQIGTNTTGHLYFKVDSSTNKLYYSTDNVTFYILN